MFLYFFNGILYYLLFISIYFSGFVDMNSSLFWELETLSYRHICTLKWSTLWLFFVNTEECAVSPRTFAFPVSLVWTPVWLIKTPVRLSLSFSPFPLPHQYFMKLLCYCFEKVSSVTFPEYFVFWVSSCRC